MNPNEIECLATVLRDHHPSTKVARAAHEELREAGLKRCRPSGCNTVKPVIEFSANKSCLDGLSGVCRSCDSAKCAADYEENHDARREKRRKYMRACYANDPKFRAYTDAKASTRRALEFSAIPLWGIRGRTMAAKVARKAELQDIVARRKAGEKVPLGGLHKWTTQEWRDEYAEFRDLLAHLNDAFNTGESAFSEEHVVPLSRGGEHCPRTNLVPMRLDLNKSKNGRLLSEWTPPANVFARVTYRTYRSGTASSVPR